jgi:opacity protein-like surface antigen
MRNSLPIFLATLVAASSAVACADALPDRLGVPSDLSSVSELESATVDSAQTLPVEEVAFKSPTASRRFYITGIVGASFANLTSGGTPQSTFPNQDLSNFGSVNNTVFTSGGAAGIAFDRPSGLLRVEFEGRQRDLLSGQTFLRTNEPTLGDVPYAVRAADGWSAMANVWRDYSVGERLGLYAGGGIGAGGYNLSASLDTNFGETQTGASAVSGFAWQAGGGVTYRFTDRLTLDLGYRFFSIGTGSTPLTYTDFVSTQPFGPYTSTFTASELLLSVRIYEPFRQWR